MALRLALLRHAKSDWSTPGLDDHDRPLGPRGIKAAPRMGRFMADNGIVPDRVLCSTALRARQTWDLASAALPAAPCWHLAELYDFGMGDAIVEACRMLGGDARTLLVVGHNPCMHNAANLLIGEGPAKARKRLAEKFPTAALAVIELPIAAWSELRRGTGTLKLYQRPGDLAR